MLLSVSAGIGFIQQPSTALLSLSERITVELKEIHTHTANEEVKLTVKNLFSFSFYMYLFFKIINYSSIKENTENVVNKTRRNV